MTTTSTALLAAVAADRSTIEPMLRTLGFEVVRLEAEDGLDAHHTSVSLCVLDLRQNGEALRLARLVRARHPEAIVIGVADPDRPSAAADAIRAGVFDVVPSPPSQADLGALISNAREQAALAAAPPELPDETPAGLAGTSPAMRSVMDLVQRASPGRCGILICGERGTGRETIARAIHANGGSRRPFVPIDCSLASPDDLEAHIFGVRSRRQAPVDRRNLERIGRDSLLLDARGGVLFLENVTDLPARLQTRLVRVLRDSEIVLDANHETVPLEVRPIASAKSANGSSIDDGRLRPDLFERLSLVRIDVPPLRQRREDIPALANHFLKELCRANGRPVKTLTRAAHTVLSALPWRGNLPELRIFLERLVLLVPNGLIRLEDVLAHTRLEGSNISPTGYDATLRQARARFERDYIAGVLQQNHGRIAEAARVLGLQRTNLYRKMRHLNLTKSKVVL